MNEIDRLISEGEDLLLDIGRAFDLQKKCDYLSVYAILPNSLTSLGLRWFESAKKYLQKNDRLLGFRIDQYELEPLLSDIYLTGCAYNSRFSDKRQDTKLLHDLIFKFKDNVFKGVEVLIEHQQGPVLSNSHEYIIKRDSEGDYSFYGNRVVFIKKSDLYFKIFYSMYKVKESGEISYKEIIDEFKALYSGKICKSQILRSLTTKKSPLYKKNRLGYLTKDKLRLIQPIRGGDALLFNNRK
jgi:hypothetical protein